MARLAVDVQNRPTAAESPVPDRADPATTVSGVPIAPLYSGADLARLGVSEQDNLGLPGQFPFTRGVHEAMYRGRLWTMRQFAGFGTPRQTNERFRFLLEKGQTGLSTAFDLPTLMGLDSDSPQSHRRGWAAGRRRRHHRRHAASSLPASTWNRSRFP